MSLWRNWIARPSPKGKIVGSNPIRDVYCNIACLAQSVERMTLNHVVVGSIPTVGVFLKTYMLLNKKRR